MFHQTIYSIENKFQISRLSPMDNRKIKLPFSPSPFLCAYSFLYLIFLAFFYFFLSMFLFILVPIKFPRLTKISPESRLCIQTFSVPLKTKTFKMEYKELGNGTRSRHSKNEIFFKLFIHISFQMPFIMC